MFLITHIGYQLKKQWLVLIFKQIFFKEINTKNISGFLKLTAGKVHDWLRQFKNSLENAYCSHSFTHSGTMY